MNAFRSALVVVLASMTLNGCTGAMSWLPSNDPVAKFAEKPADCANPKPPPTALHAARQRACEMQVAYTDAMGTAQGLSDKINLSLLGLGAATAGLAITGTTGVPLIALILAGATGFTANELFVPGKAHREVFAVGAEASSCVRGLADEYLRAANGIPNLRAAIAALDTARLTLAADVGKLREALNEAADGERLLEYWKTANQLADDAGAVLIEAESVVAAARSQINALEVTAPSELDRALTAIRVAIKKAALTSSPDTSTVRNAIQAFQANVPAAYTGLLASRIKRGEVAGTEIDAASQRSRMSRSSLAPPPTNEARVGRAATAVRTDLTGVEGAKVAVKAAADAAAVPNAQARLQECVTKARSAPTQNQVHVTPSSVTAKPGDTVHVAVTDGNGPFTAVLIGADPAKVGIKLPQGTFSADTATKVADLPISVDKDGTPGAYSILVSDAGGVLKTSTQVLLTVSAPPKETPAVKETPALSMSPKDAPLRTVAAGGTLQVTLAGGTPPYIVESLTTSAGPGDQIDLVPTAGTNVVDNVVKISPKLTATPGKYVLKVLDKTLASLDIDFTVTAAEGPQRMSAVREPTFDDVQAAQALLRYRGDDPGPVDGLLGSRTRGAIVKFQRAEKLEDTGTLTKATRERLGMAEVGLVKGDIESAQRFLRGRGEYDGKVDGVQGAPFAAALVKFQRRHGLAPTGALDAATLGAMAREQSVTLPPTPGRR